MLTAAARSIPETQAHEFLERRPEGERHDYEYDSQSGDPRSFKAELVRRNLISRKDLMHLYKPPMKQAALPSNNPFITKTILQPPVTQSMFNRLRSGSQASPRMAGLAAVHGFAHRGLPDDKPSLNMGII